MRDQGATRPAHVGVASSALDPQCARRVPSMRGGRTTISLLCRLTSEVNAYPVPTMLYGRWHLQATHSTTHNRRWERWTYPPSRGRPRGRYWPAPPSALVVLRLIVPGWGKRAAGRTDGVAARRASRRKLASLASLLDNSLRRAFGPGAARVPWDVLHKVLCVALCSLHRWFESMLGVAPGDSRGPGWPERWMGGEKACKQYQLSSSLVPPDHPLLSCIETQQF